MTPKSIEQKAEEYTKEHYKLDAIKKYAVHASVAYQAGATEMLKDALEFLRDHVVSSDTQDNYHLFTPHQINELERIFK